jgi:hypothetical protein
MISILFIAVLTSNLTNLYKIRDNTKDKDITYRKLYLSLMQVVWVPGSIAGWDLWWAITDTDVLRAILFSPVNCHFTHAPY